MKILLSSDMPAHMRDKISALTGCEAVALPGHPALPGPVRSHPDTLIFAAGGDIVADREYYEANRRLFEGIGRNVIYSEKPLGGQYPLDAALNAFCTGGVLYARLASLSERIKEMFPHRVNVRQGYARCSTALLPDGAAITADQGIAAALADNGIDVLPISPGGISLPGYDTGFIGGASFAFEDKLFFFGDISGHPDAVKINDYLDKHFCRPVCLASGVLYDFGGAVLI